MCLKSSMAEKRGPHKDCPLVEALQSYTCTHIGTSTYAQTRIHRHKHDAWARVRTDNLCQRHWWRQSMRTRVSVSHTSTGSIYPNPSHAAHLPHHFTTLHLLPAHINTQPLLYFNTMRSGTHISTHTHLPSTFRTIPGIEKHTCAATHTLFYNIRHTHITQSQKRWWRRRGVREAPLHL